MTVSYVPIAVVALLASLTLALPAAGQSAAPADFGIIAPGSDRDPPGAAPSPTPGFSPDMLQIIDSAYAPLRQRPDGSVETDRSLRPGDIVVTVDGLKVFRGWNDGAQGAFVPLSDAALPAGERALLALIDRQVRGENGGNAQVRREAPAIPPRPLAARATPVTIIDDRFLR